MKKLILAVPFAMALAFTTPASAQQSGLVNVNISNLDVLENVGVDVSNLSVPVTVQVPVGVAANVCPDVDANVLAQQYAGTSDIACEVGSVDQTTQAFNQAIQRDRSRIEQN